MSPLAAVANRDLVAQQYDRWLESPASVSPEWQLFFAGFSLGAEPIAAVGAAAAEGQAKVDRLIAAYRHLGHLIAQVDPLGDRPTTLPELALEQFGLSPDDLGREFDAADLPGAPRRSLADIVALLDDTYCRSVGAEFTHIQDLVARAWLRVEMESCRNRPALATQDRVEILKQLIDAELFETFLHSRYQGQKRFSLEGAESLIPALHAFMETAARSGAQEVVMGMAHRGRLNVLANILGKPYTMIFHEFEDTIMPERAGDGGDVKYHRGYSSTYRTRAGATLHLSLTANPSHLEVVAPVVEGRTRAKQRRAGDAETRNRILPLILHGDAAFAGQGLVAETFNLSQLPGYKTGGTVHIVVNNQIGFTTSAGEARSSRYSTDVAKLVDAPILHVNGDDPEAVVWVTDLALRYRQRFGRDVVVDLFCYRRHGHNEGDEPAFTQPLMYHRIQHRPSVRSLYQLELEGALVLTLADSGRLTDEFQQRLYAAFKTVKESTTAEREPESFVGVWAAYAGPYDHAPVATGVSEATLVEVATGLARIPDGFNLNRKIARRLPEQLATVTGGGSVDWSQAEALAFGSLLLEGVGVRLSGQDSARGTFSQRHAAWFDTKTGERWVPLAHLRPDQPRFCVYNSMLSEAAVLGFDYGYALVEPEMLVLWEAQFGDFANGAQVIIDQFIAAALDKWRRACGIVLLLPHGYEGQGPEHSNAYPERYLLLCAEDNIQVCNLTTPAQYFHLLRRQVIRPLRRPLVLMAPKSLLRHKGAVSPVADLVHGGFREVLDDPTPPAAARRLVLCSGKVYYDLVEARAERGVNDVAVVRLEQLYPFNDDLFAEVVAPYRGAREVVWVQEETKNRGGWTYMMPLLQERFLEHAVRYVGREASASPATGSGRVHRAEQQQIVDEALAP